MMSETRAHDGAERWPRADVYAAKEELSGRILSRGAERFSRGLEAVRDSGPPGISLVHAVGVGRKEVGGLRAGPLAVRVYVTRKLPLSELAAAAQIPAQVDGIVTDVVEAPMAVFAMGTPPCSALRQATHRPVVAGVSTGTSQGPPGTIGCFCRSVDPLDSPLDRFALSCRHIYAPGPTVPVGARLLQPAAGDGATPASEIARLHRATEMVTGGASNRADAAIGRLRGDVLTQNEICSIGTVTRSGRALEDELVEKHGRTTGLTRGVVDDELIDCDVFPPNSTTFARFKNQLRIVPASGSAVVAKLGDSGSLVVRRDEDDVVTAVGLLFAAAPDGSFAYANHWDDIQAELKIAIL